MHGMDSEGELFFFYADVGKLQCTASWSLVNKRSIQVQEDLKDLVQDRSNCLDPYLNRLTAKASLPGLIEQRRILLPDSQGKTLHASDKLR